MEISVYIYIYDEFVHSFKIIAHERLIRTYPIKHCVLFVFYISDYFFIKNIVTLRAFHNLRTHMMCFAKKTHDIQSHGLMMDNFNLELRVRRTYDLSPLLS